ncbi:hypothetical protein WG908_13265 [Sphingobium sp. AN641]|uniref:hypothetical protein n=1 Tax=Sphingobium sp. AN641 TaxID=3133443 RepID=UPI0030BABDAA
MAASLCLGLGLGHYATTMPMRDVNYDLPEVAEDDLLPPPLAAGALNGPARIICKGCGPTLAERRFAADMAALDADAMVHGSRDPAVVDYMRDDVPDPYPAVYPPAAEPSPVHRLPASVQRFADGGSGPPAATSTMRTLSDAPAAEPAIGP